MPGAFHVAPLSNFSDESDFDMWKMENESRKRDST